MLGQSRTRQGPSPYLQDVGQHQQRLEILKRPTMSLKRNFKLVRLVKEVMEVVVVELSTKQRVTVHWKHENMNKERITMPPKVCLLPEVSGWRFENFFSARLSGVSEGK